MSISDELNLIIDFHEDDVIKTLELESLKPECGHIMFDIETLEVGDFLYKRGDVPICLVERKKVSDWVSSITDKRTKSQMIRISELKKTYPNLIVIFLMEGAFVSRNQKFHGKIDQKILYTSMIHRVIRDRCTVYHSSGLEDTALILAQIYNQLVAKLDLSIVDPVTQRLDYLKTIKLTPKDNLTPLNCYVSQLAQIPGASIDSADVISQHYPSMRDLILAYENLSTIGEKQNMLKNIALKNHKLGPVLSKRIYEYLCPEPIKTKTKIALKPLKLKLGTSVL